ncbi:ribosomal RNA processing protein 36 homolog [Lineus longissimus]|uniref:ribosomal RNA processing protein 36 homolog n=1 Tax=Lineus longissimus TaxID=88925 RepID=UPI00315D0B89
MMSKRSGKYEVTRQTGSKRKRMLMAEKLKAKTKMSVQKLDTGGFTKGDSLKNMKGPTLGVVSKQRQVTYKDQRRVSDRTSSSEASESESDSTINGVIGVQDEVVPDKLTGESNSEYSDSESSDEEMKTSQMISAKTSKNNKLSMKAKSDSSGDTSASDSEDSSNEDEKSQDISSKAKRVKLSNEKEIKPADGEMESEDESSENGVSDESDGDASNYNKDKADNSNLREELEETTGNDEYDSIRKEIANMPFDELQKLRERVGSKVYYQALFGKGNHETGKKRIFKRANKNRPMEMSSKAPVRRYRQMQAKKAKVTRDPRFDDLSGTYNENLFKRSYGFIDDIKAKEKEKIQKKLKKEKDPDKVVNMKYLVNRMTQQEKSDKEKERKSQQSREIKKKEKALVQEGKTPFYLKKSEKKKFELAEKFRELKKSGKLEKYLNRKRKKTASKDRKHLPNMHSR